MVRPIQLVLTAYPLDQMEMHPQTIWVLLALTTEQVSALIWLDRWTTLGVHGNMS